MLEGVGFVEGGAYGYKEPAHVEEAAAASDACTPVARDPAVERLPYDQSLDDWCSRRASSRSLCEGRAALHGIARRGERAWLLLPTPPKLCGANCLWRFTEACPRLDACDSRGEFNLPDARLARCLISTRRPAARVYDVAFALLCSRGGDRLLRAQVGWFARLLPLRVETSPLSATERGLIRP